MFIFLSLINFLIYIKNWLQIRLIGKQSCTFINLVLGPSFFGLRNIVIRVCFSRKSRLGRYACQLWKQHSCKYSVQILISNFINLKFLKFWLIILIGYSFFFLFFVDFYVAEEGRVYRPTITKHVNGGVDTWSRGISTVTDGQGWPIESKELPSLGASQIRDLSDLLHLVVRLQARCLPDYSSWRWS